MPRSLPVRIVPWLLLALLVGCGASDSGPRLLGTFPLHAAADLPELPAEAGIVSDPELGPVLHVEAQGVVRVPLLETDVPPLQADSLGVGGRLRVEVIGGPVRWQLRLEDAEGGVRVITTDADEYVRTHGWSPLHVAFGLEEGTQPVRVTLSVLAPPGRIWLEEVELWDGVPAAGGAP